MGIFCLWLKLDCIYNKNNTVSSGKLGIQIEQGATLSYELQYKDANGNPIDLTNWSGRMQIRPSPADPTVYLTLSSSLQADGSGLNFSGSSGTKPPTSGSIGVFISAASSSALSFNTAFYDLIITSGSYVTRLLEGQVQLSPDTTR